MATGEMVLRVADMAEFRELFAAAYELLDSLMPEQKRWNPGFARLESAVAAIEQKARG